MMNNVMSRGMESMSQGHWLLQVVCGPRYNAFVPVRDRGEQADRFFRAATVGVEEEGERWDGME